jgi:hypothetical protein
VPRAGHPDKDGGGIGLEDQQAVFVSECLDLVYQVTRLSPRSPPDLQP